MDHVRAAPRPQGIEINPDAFRGAHLLWVTREGADPRALVDLPELLGGEGGFVWLDLPRSHTDTAVALEALFGFHQISLRDAKRPNVVPKAQAFDDHTFLILHAVDRPTRAGRSTWSSWTNGWATGTWSRRTGRSPAGSCPPRRSVTSRRYDT